jgi:tetratricopeptide (TPR) repeat protein
VKLNRRLTKKSINMTTQLNAWKLFLRGRIHQEKNQLGEAIQLFDEALTVDPDNTSFMRAKFIAFSTLTGLNTSQKNQIDEIRTRYEELGKKLSGNNDVADVWIKELSNLISNIEEVEKSPKLSAVAAVSVVW